LSIWWRASGLCKNALSTYLGGLIFTNA